MTGREEWLLRPVHPRPTLEEDPGPLPSPRPFFVILAGLLGKESIALGEQIPPKEYRRAMKVLRVLEAVNEDRKPGPEAERFLHAWNTDDLDWFHAALRRLPAYDEAVLKLQQAPQPSLSKRNKNDLRMARALGQVARFQGSRQLFVGDSPVGVAEFSDFLRNLIPLGSWAKSNEELCYRAATELGLTPARFERAMVRLWKREEGEKFSGGTGGTCTEGIGEEVAELSPEGFGFRFVSPGILTYRSAHQIRCISRRK